MNIYSEHNIDDNMNLQPEHFCNISCGRKSWELRINDAKRKLFKVGDDLKFQCNGEIVTTVIIEKRYYDTFEEGLRDIGIRRVLPDLDTIEEGVKLYENIYGSPPYSDEIVAFKIALNPKPTTHYLPILNPPNCPVFDLIKSGIKKVEGRTNISKYREYKVGDRLKIEVTGGKNKGEKCDVLITDIVPYYDVEEYLCGEGYVTLADGSRRLAALPCLKTFREGIDLYNTWTTPEKRAVIRRDPGSGGNAFLGIRIAVI